MKTIDDVIHELQSLKDKYGNIEVVHKEKLVYSVPLLDVVELSNRKNAIAIS